MKDLKQEELKLYSPVSMDKMLMDVRQNRYGLRFGTVKDVCSQYGIKYKENNGVIEFSAPKLRLQMFIEKLHFSRTPYSKKSL